MKKIKAAGALILGLWALVSTGGAHAQSPVVFDNGAAQFATMGTWPTSTTVPGFEGANYQTHEAQGSPPGAIVVDNTDAGFTVTGTWPTSTAVSGFLGANYQVHAGNGEEPTAIVVDNTAGTAVGSWPTSTSVSGFFGTNYQVHAAGTGGDTFTWTPTIPTTGSYQVYARWTIHPNRSTHAVYTVNHAGGATPVTVNQEVGGGQWNLLGTFTLNAGSSHSVVLSIQDDGYVIADAIKVVPQGAAPNTASWTPTVPTAKAYHVYARWTAHPNRATDAKYTVTHAGGETTVTINQELNNGAWVLLGTFNLAPGAGHKVSLTDQANGYVIADAVRLIGTDEPQVNSATWSPNLTGEHQVYAKWTANPNRATNATYTITHAGGATPVTVNQQANGGQFNLLGSFTLTPASTITLTDNANGFVIADAIQLVSAAPVALQLYFVHTDHLNTPRLIANSTGQAVWSWNNDDPFGANAPNENPSGLGLFTCNLRFPGQYFDKKTNLHYNMMRDYDPAIGRYIQSDPIGIIGQLKENSDNAKFQHFLNGSYRLALARSQAQEIYGLAAIGNPGIPETLLYGYADNNSLSYSDPRGELSVLGWVVVGAAIVGAAAGLAIYWTKKCGELCTPMCPIPDTGDPFDDQSRRAWIAQCSVDCVKAGAGILRKFGAPVPPIDIIIN